MGEFLIKSYFHWFIDHLSFLPLAFNKRTLEHSKAEIRTF
jgi:hypothetical protein